MTAGIALAATLLGARWPGARAFVVDGTFWCLAVTLALLASTWWPVAEQRRERTLLMVTLAGATLVATLIFIVVPPRFRVLSDESNLVSTSLSLFRHRTLENITELWRGQVLARDLATRPGLYPFLVALPHFLFGFHARHAFVVNFLVCAGTLAATTLLGRRLRSLRFGVIAAALVAAFPLFDLAVTSAGYDALNLLLLTLVMIELVRVAREPEGRALERLVLLTALAAQCRYESILLVLPVALILWARRSALARARLSVRAVVAPLLFLPPVLQRLVLGVVGTERGQPELAHRAAFSLGYLGVNVVHDLELFVHPGRTPYPIAYVTVALAIVGAAMLLLRLRDAGARRRLGLPLGALALALGPITLVHLSFAMGDLRTAFNLRFATAYVVAFALLAAWPLERLARRLHFADWQLGLLLAALVAVYLPVARRNQFIGALSLPTEYRRNLEVLAARGGRVRAVVTDRTGMYVAQGLDAVNATYFTRIHPRLQLGVDEVVVIQEVPRRGTGEPTPALSPSIPLELIARYASSGDREIRISVAR